MILSYDSTLIQKVLGKQGQSQCGVYAIAYGFSILEKKCRVSGNPASHKAVASAYNPKDFAQVYWGNDGLTSHSASSVTSRYSAILSELKSGRPVVVAVQGSSYNHYVLVLGVKDNKTASTVSPTDFFIADPADAKLGYYGTTWANAKGFNNSGYGLQYATFNSGSASKTGTAVSSSSYTPKPAVRYSRSIQDVIDGACRWAEMVAADNSFHYGHGKAAHHYGCYFCGTNKKSVKSGIVDYEKTYCCNPFVFSAFAHGGGETYMLAMCKKGKNSNTTIFRSGSSKQFKNLGKPSFSSLRKGDVLWRDNGSSCHYALYLGGNRLAEATGGDDNKRNSSKWNNSIRVRSISGYGSFTHASRYIGSTYGGVMELPDGSVGTDTGIGLDMRQAISKLYSSANYEYIQQVEEEEAKSAVLGNKFKDSIKTALNNLDFKVVPTGAIAEPVVNQAASGAEFEIEKPKKVASSRPSNLLSYPTMVEAPTIILDFNGTKIGGYGNVGDTYPNYITSMSVKKINGRINQYTINLTYQVRYGEDPNFIDKLISQTGYTNPLKILYGDANYPGAYYREESAVIMDAKHTEDVGAYKINYNISAISSLAASQASFRTFPSRTAKPSTIIYDLLYNSGEISNNLLELFPGMQNKTLVSSKGLIPTNDAVIDIGGMANVSALTYLSYLVACMHNPNSNSTFYLSIVDNSLSDFNGSYFKISEVESNNGQLVNLNTASNYYELDIGFPSNNYITNFQVCNNNYWSLVYNYAGDIPKFEYGIDDNGDLITKKSNILHIVDKYSESSLISSNWWRQVTEFPISAKVTLKGLLNPAMLMSYIKINALFYGQRDLSSGIYVVTAQEDSISGSGYTTELTLLRVAED